MTVRYSRLFGILFVICFFTVLRAQKIVQGDSTILNIYKGQFNKTYQLREGQLIKNGAFRFESDLIKNLDKKELQKLNIQGSHKDGKFHGYWSYSELNYLLKIKDVNQGRTHTMEYSLDGNETRVVMRFNNGRASGRWMIDRYKIENSRQRDLQNSGYIFCDNGHYTGEFFFQNEEKQLSIRGQLNPDGFLHGPMIIRWRNEEQKDIREERIYQNGFLLVLNRYENDDQKPMVSIEFTDVQTQINDLRNNPNSAIQVSKGHYGIRFDNGYKANDLRAQMQNEGTEILAYFLGVFDRYLDESSGEVLKPEIRFTKRFVFDYQDDEQLLSNMATRAQVLKQKSEQFLILPSNILYASQSDSVSRSMKIMEHILSKTEIIDDFLQKNAQGYFESRNRNNYFSQGIPGLQSNETLYFKSRKDSLSIEWKPKRLVNSPESLVENMNAYLQFLETLYERQSLMTSTRVSDLLQSETLRKTDSLIVSLEHLNSSQFGNVDDLAKQPFDRLSFEQKIYLLAYQKKLSQIRKSYLSKTEFNEKKEFGNQYIENLKNLNEQYERLREVGRRQKRIDSVFTLYEDNPFDYRKIELPILAQIKEKGLILFRHYAEMLYAETRPERFEQRLVLIENLLNKMEYFAANHTQQEVLAINRAARRETVPGRIERIFELTNE